MFGAHLGACNTAIAQLEVQEQPPIRALILLIFSVSICLPCSIQLTILAQRNDGQAKRDLLMYRTGEKNSVAVLGRAN
jgi:hypothetical protein